ncbi:MAG: DUF29 domain-containing protein [Spirulina sp.]
MTSTPIQTLYDRDFALWVEDTVQSLKSREFDRLDLENLIEEIESLEKRDRRELKSRLITLFEHLLKRQYVSLPDCYRGWEATIKRTQSKLRDILTDSPSLRNFLREIYPDCYQEAWENVKIECDANFPDRYPWFDDLERLLSYKFWESDL